MANKSKKKQSVPETFLAGSVVDWLVEQKWDVYQEVQIKTYGSVADIVALQGNILQVIECKKTLSMDVIAQAYNWRRHANFISVAVPRHRRKRTNGRLFAEQVLSTFGIGLIVVDYRECVVEIVQPSLNRKAKTDLVKEALSTEQKTFAKAGNSEGKRWTPFQQTSLNILREVKKRPGITMKELMERINHHYSTPSAARTCIAKWAKYNVIKGVRLEKEGRVLKLYPAGHVK